MRVSLAFLFVFAPLILFSQVKDTTVHVLFDTNKIKNTSLLSTASDTISKDFYIWNDKKNLSEIMDEKSGYFINYFGVGGRNLIKYNGSNEYSVGIYRDGIQLNDNFFGGFDIENISVNEIEKIEEISNVSSFMYGINSRAKSINVITKDRFQPKLFSQFRYSQDRYGALSADFYVNMPLSRKINYIFEINNHINDGRYTNTDFSAWRGKVKLNYYFSPKFNIRTNLNYSKVQRGLYEGIIYSTDDTLASSIFAKVNNIDSYEKVINYLYDITLTARIFKDSISLTKLKLYTNSTLREYRDEENRITTNGIYLTNNFHYLQYGIDFKQNIKKTFGEKYYTDILFGGNAYYNFYKVNKIFFDWSTASDNPQVVRFLKNNFYTGIGKIDIGLDKLFLSGFAKTSYIDNNFFFETGVEGNYKLVEIKDFSFSVHSGANSTMSGINYPELVSQDYISLLNIYNTSKQRYIEAGVKIKYKNFTIDLYQFDNNYSNNLNFRNGNYSIDYKSTYFDGYININQWNYADFPDFFLKTDLAVHDYLFANKLNLKVGVNIKYFSNFYPELYSQYRYLALNFIPQNISKNFFNMDFYVGARIGTANINFTLGNLFNNLNYDSYLYPYDNRGGFVNVVSKFTIVWDFNQ